MQLLISEMVDQLESMKTVAERKEFLYKNRNTRLKEFFEHSYGKVDWYIDDEEQLPEELFFIINIPMKLLRESIQDFRPIIKERPNTLFD